MEVFYTTTVYISVPPSQTHPDTSISQNDTEVHSEMLQNLHTSMSLRP